MRITTVLGVALIMGCGSTAPPILHGEDVDDPSSGPELSGVLDVAARGDKTCAVHADGGVWCWGWGREASPTLIHRVQGAVEIAMGGAHTCVRTEAGEAYCWGRGLTGSLGDWTEDIRKVLSRLSK